MIRALEAFPLRSKAAICLRWRGLHRWLQPTACSTRSQARCSGVRCWLRPDGPGACAQTTGGPEGNATNLRHLHSEQPLWSGDLWQIWPWPICRSFPWPLVLPALRRLLVCGGRRGGGAGQTPVEWARPAVARAAWCVIRGTCRALEAVITAAAAQDWLAARAVASPITGPGWPHMNTCSGSRPGSQQSFEVSIQQRSSSLVRAPPTY